LHLKTQEMERRMVLDSNSDEGRTKALQKNLSSAQINELNKIPTYYENINQVEDAFGKFKEKYPDWVGLGEMQKKMPEFNNYTGKGSGEASKKYEAYTNLKKAIETMLVPTIISKEGLPVTDSTVKMVGKSLSIENLTLQQLEDRLKIERERLEHKNAMYSEASGIDNVANLPMDRERYEDSVGQVNALVQHGASKIINAPYLETVTPNLQANKEFLEQKVDHVLQHDGSQKEIAAEIMGERDPTKLSEKEKWGTVSKFIASLGTDVVATGASRMALIALLSTLGLATGGTAGLVVTMLSSAAGGVLPEDPCGRAASYRTP